MLSNQIEGFFGVGVRDFTSNFDVLVPPRQSGNYDQHTSGCTASALALPFHYLSQGLCFIRLHVSCFTTGLPGTSSCNLGLFCEAGGDKLTGVGFNYSGLLRVVRRPGFETNHGE